MSKQPGHNLEVHSPPSDAISSLVFSPSSPQHLLVSSWDNTVRLYDVQQNILQLKYEHMAPVLDCCFSDGFHGFSGGLDKRVKAFDFNTSNQEILGEHDGPIKSIRHSQEANVLITGSWDRTLRSWDTRAKDALIDIYNLPGKVFAMDVIGNLLVVAMSERQVYIYDLRDMKQTLQKRESSLKFMTRTVKCMPNGLGYASTSIEGRIAVEFFDPSPETQAQKYAFKCHRQNINGNDSVYPVHALAFHPKHQMNFASGGGDGIVAIWDGKAKKRIRQYSRYPNTIAALSFNLEGTMLAVASSYTYEEGEKDVPPDQIFIRMATSDKEWISVPKK